MEEKNTLQRPLTDRECESIQHALETTGIAEQTLCTKALEECLVLRRTPMLGEVDSLASGIAYAALKTRASGITLGNRIFIRREFFSDDGEIPLELLAHEVAHVVQFLRDGTLPFLWRYVWDYARGLSKGLGDRSAYLAIPYEVEARRVADALPRYAGKSD